MTSGQVALTCEPEETILPYVLETMGQHLVMYASDYAHWDSEFPESVRLVASLPGLTDEQKRRCPRPQRRGMVRPHSRRTPRNLGLFPARGGDSASALSAAHGNYPASLAGVRCALQARILRLELTTY